MVYRSRKIKKSFKIRLLIAGLFLLVLHFAALLIYANPFAGHKSKASFLAHAYVYPYFHQNWNLFAPAPDTNYQLYVEYDDHGPQRTDVFGELVSKHQSNRLLGHEPLLIAFSNSIHYFEKNSNLREALNGPVKNDLNFTILERTVKNYLRITRSCNITPKRLILVVEDIGTQKKRVYFN